MSKSPSYILLSDLISGKTKLWQAWWIFYTIPHFFISLFIAFATPLEPATALIIIVLLGFLIPTSAVVWKCSNNCKNPKWTIVVKTLIILHSLSISPDINRYTLPIYHPINLALICTLLIIMICVVGRLKWLKKLTGFNNEYLIPALLIFNQLGILVGTLIVEN